MRDPPSIPPIEAAALRFHDEPCTRLGDAEVHTVLAGDPLATLDAFDRDLEAIAAGRLVAEVPPKALYPDAHVRGDFRVMVAVLSEPRLKLVKVVGTNHAGRVVPDQITVGRVLVLDPTDQHVAVDLAACALSSARTGVVAALAIRRLATRRERVAIVGAGRVGFYAGLYAACAGVPRLLVSDRDPARSAVVVAALQARGIDAAIGPPEGADVVVLATTASEPVLPWLPVPLVVSLGADARDQRELADGWAAAELWSDGPDSLLVGDLFAWQARDPTLASRLRYLVAAPATPPEGPRAMISTGNALFDALAVRFVLGSLNG
jgi:ornithine cyclodeaminase/alanine dehydrogenase-like protein (mu-crystallin family)